MPCPHWDRISILELPPEQCRLIRDLKTGHASLNTALKGARLGRRCGNGTHGWQAWGRPGRAYSRPGLCCRNSSTSSGSRLQPAHSDTCHYNSESRYSSSCLRLSWREESGKETCKPGKERARQIGTHSWMHLKTTGLISLPQHT